MKQSKEQNKQLARFLQEAKTLSVSSFATSFEDRLGPDLYPAFFGRTLSLFAAGTDQRGRKYRDLLNEIPTETTVHERTFLFNFFKDVWSGHYHVLEIGPFLGGSTRAMAMGMQLNSSRLDRCRLFTFDKFDDYYNPDRLIAFLAPLFQKGLLGQEAEDHIKSTSEFQTLFRLIHQNHAYYRFLDHAEGVLPKTADEIAALKNIFRLPPAAMFDAVFIDDCKSWYGTKYFMQAVCDHVTPGSHFIFQDYGAFTCFWIPVFMTLMREHFKLVACVDNTYTFRLTKSLDAQTISAGFPDSPEQIDQATFEAIFEFLLMEAADRNDTFCLQNYELQHAAALAYLGDREEAYARIKRLLNIPYFRKYDSLIRLALECPTYTPEGNIYLSAPGADSN